jgi:hypothetical protein
MRGTMGDQLFVHFRRKVLAEDKLYQAEYVGSGIQDQQAQAKED